MKLTLAHPGWTTTDGLGLEKISRRLAETASRWSLGLSFGVCLGSLRLRSSSRLWRLYETLDRQNLAGTNTEFFKEISFLKAQTSHKRQKSAE